MRIGIIAFSVITATEKLISDNGYLMIWPLRRGDLFNDEMGSHRWPPRYISIRADEGHLATTVPNGGAEESRAITLKLFEREMVACSRGVD